MEVGIGITQETQKIEKTKFNKCQIIRQFRRISSTNSPSSLHMKHQSATMCLLFLKLSMVQMGLSVHIVKATLGGNFAFQIIFQGKIDTPSALQ